MAVCQEKTDTKLWIYCPERLQAYLETLPRTGRHILARNLTQPLGKRAAQKAVEDVREALGLMHGENRLVPHGWRYTAARLLAEAGCSDSEIQAVTGHKTLSMVQKYRAQANQRAASKRAQQRRGR
ncbi:tyrosine-type recombinase/integrase [Roseibaca sp. V10]|uniref:Tyrosine-type recombinase/integrase n=1 Tax=Roseinatronobacter domitianus TaxID=2940293 RepID=A0ABT0M438_9RHOB|nr:tyrosine-type recombinase/integrase [Roseibaca domitiana]MCL1629625.1 tyrosine-type recombinase/integrase [Roseibaca domitiana]